MPEVDAMFIEDIREAVERMDMMLDSQAHASQYLVPKPRAQ